MGSEMLDPPSSPGTTSYRLPKVTIDLSLTVFAVLRMFQTDRRNSSIAIGGTALKSASAAKNCSSLIDKCSSVCSAIFMLSTPVLLIAVLSLLL